MAYNEIAERQQHLTSELARVQRVAGREGRHSERLQPGVGEGGWAKSHRGRQQPGLRPRPPDGRAGPRRRRRLRGRPDAAHGPRPGRPAAARRAAQAGQERERAGRPALRHLPRDHAGDPRGRHRGQAGRPGTGPQRRRRLARPDRRRQRDVVAADRAGARHRPGDDGRGERRPVQDRDRRGVRRDGPAEGHRRPDGRPAVVVRLRGDARGPRGRHRGTAGRPGRRTRRVRHLEGPHRLGERDGVQPDQPGARHLVGRPGGGPRRPEPADHGDRARRGGRAGARR